MSPPFSKPGKKYDVGLAIRELQTLPQCLGKQNVPAYLILSTDLKSIFGIADHQRIKAPKNKNMINFRHKRVKIVPPDQRDDSTGA